MSSDIDDPSSECFQYLITDEDFEKLKLPGESASAAMARLGAKALVADALDQTIGFWCDEGFTTTPGQAKLYETVEDAQAQIEVFKRTWAPPRGDVWPWVEYVIDITAFQSAPDTW